MMCWLPSWFCDARTTEGDEYAWEVTQVQCATKNESMQMALKMTTKRVSRLWIPYCRRDDLDRVGVSGDGENR